MQPIQREHLNRMIKKVVIYLFSGTGNTRITGEFLKEHFENRGVEVTLYNIAFPYKRIPDPNDFDLVCFGYPIHAFNFPKPFFQFVKNRLPKITNEVKNCFIFKVSGEPFFFNNASSAHLMETLRKKNLHLIGEKNILMPYDIIFRYSDDLAKQMYLYNKAITEGIVTLLINEKKESIKYNVFLRFLSFLFRIEWIAGAVNCKLCHVDMKKCSNCNLCINKCPTNSIYIKKNGKIGIHPSCSICMNCAYSCPKDAFFMGFLNHWKVNGRFNYVKLANDPLIKGTYINKSTKGYFKKFIHYYKKQNEFLILNNIKIPVVYDENEEY